MMKSQHSGQIETYRAEQAGAPYTVHGDACEEVAVDG